MDLLEVLVEDQEKGIYVLYCYISLTFRYPRDYPVPPRVRDFGPNRPPSRGDPLISPRSLSRTGDPYQNRPPSRDGYPVSPQREYHRGGVPPRRSEYMNNRPDYRDSERRPPGPYSSDYPPSEYPSHSGAPGGYNRPSIPPPGRRSPPFNPPPRTMPSSGEFGAGSSSRGDGPRSAPVGLEGPRREYPPSRPSSARPLEYAGPPSRFNRDYMGRGSEYPPGRLDYRHDHHGPYSRPSAYPPPSHGPSLMASMSGHKRPSSNLYPNSQAQPARSSLMQSSRMKRGDDNSKNNSSLSGSDNNAKRLDDSMEIDQEKTGVDSANSATLAHDSHNTPYEDDEESDASSFEQEEVEMEIERVDNAIAKQEQIIATARSKIAAAEKIAREKAAGIESQEKVRQRLLPDSIMEEYRSRQLEHNTDPPLSISQLIGDIYTANRKLVRVFQEKSRERDMVLFNIGNLDLTCGDDVKEALRKLEPTPPVLPSKKLYSAEFNPLVRPLLVNHLRTKLFEVQEEEEELVNVYQDLYEEWAKRVEKLEVNIGPVKPLIDTSNSAGKGPVSGILGGTSSSSPSKPSEDPVPVAAAASGGRTSRRSGFRSDAVRSEAEWQKALSFLGILPEDSANASAPQPFSSDKLAKEVVMVTDSDIRQNLKFIDHNSLVQDPEKELQDLNTNAELKWSDYDKAVFKAKLMQYGKDFYKIASFLEQKSIQDCVTYYYREKVNLRFKNLLRRSQSGRGRRRKDKNENDIQPPSFKTLILMEEEEFIYPAYYSESGEPSSSSDDDERKHYEPEKKLVIHDPLSTPVSPLGSPTLVDQQNSNWTDEETQRALRGFELFGRDFFSVSAMIGTKTPYQCKAFFNNYRRHSKEEKGDGSVEKKGKEVVKKKGKPGRKRTESFAGNSNLASQKPNSLTILDDTDTSQQELGGEKKRKADMQDQSLKKSKKNEETSGDGPRKTISYWSVSERQEFLTALATHGKNFELISQDLQSKSAIQCRNYFHNSRKKLNLDELLCQHGHQSVAEPTTKPMDVDEPAEPVFYESNPAESSIPEQIYHHPGIHLVYFNLNVDPSLPEQHYPYHDQYYEYSSYEQNYHPYIPSQYEPNAYDGHDTLHQAESHNRQSPKKISVSNLVGPSETEESSDVPLINPIDPLFESSKGNE